MRRSRGPQAPLVCPRPDFGSIVGARSFFSSGEGNTHYGIRLRSTPSRHMPRHGRPTHGRWKGTMEPDQIIVLVFRDEQRGIYFLPHNNEQTIKQVVYMHQPGVVPTFDQLSTNFPWQAQRPLAFCCLYILFRVVPLFWKQRMHRSCFYF